MVGTWPVVGRDEELEVIAAALQAPRGHRPGVVLAGAPGVGKTCLARAALERLAGNHTVRWVGATYSARSLALGALTSLVGDVGGAPAGLIARAAAALTATEHRPVVLGVDDAQHLDDLSAAVVHHIVLSGAAPVVLTLRSGTPAPDAVTSLWKDGYLPRIDLQALSDRETALLLPAVLGGPVDDLSAHRLWRLSGGIALFLCHLVDEEVAAGRLRVRDGIWEWCAERPALSTPLVNIVEERMGVLPESVGRVVDLLAVGEPLTVALLQGLAGLPAIEEAEMRGLITVDSADATALTARLAHPLYGDARLARCGPSQVRRLRGEVASALASLSDCSGEHQLRRAMLTLDSDLPPDPDLFTSAAQIAFLRSDLDGCERLAAAALACGGGGFAARLVRGYACTWMGRGDDAELELAQCETEAVGNSERAVAATARAANLFWGMNEAARAESVLDRAETVVDDDDERAAMTAMRAAFSATEGRPEDAVTYARTALAHAPLPGPSVALAAVGLVGGLGALGQADRVAAAAGRGYAGAVGAVNEAFLRMWLCAFHINALVGAGYLYPAEQIAADQHARTRWVLGPAHLFGETMVGCVAVTRGQLNSAIKLLGEVRAGLGSAGANGFDYFCLLSLCRAYAMAGNVDDARMLLGEMNAAGRLGFNHMAGVAMLDRAWVEAAAGDSASAVRGAHEAAALANQNHQWSLEVIALQMAVRFGDGNCHQRLRELAALVDGPRAPAAADHAAALTSGNGPALDDVATACEAMGDLTAAADAAAHAAMAYQRRGMRRAALAAAARAHDLAARTGARTPALSALTRIGCNLTDRQREIAALVSRGMSNQEIADALAMSVRTVEGHVYRACALLGVTGRGEIASVIGGS